MVGLQMNARSQILMAVGGLLGAVIMLAAPGVAVAAETVAGTTLTYRQASDGQRSTEVIARTDDGRVAVLQSSDQIAYVQYDGAKLWVCKMAEKCRVAAQGTKARKGAENISDSFFRPNGPSGLAGVFMTKPRPAGAKTIAGVVSDCKVSPVLLESKQTATLCTARKGGFLTLLKTGGETYRLARFVDQVESSFLTLPTGVWNGSISSRGCQVGECGSGLASADKSSRDCSGLL
jgi:hypothetical protein